MAEAEDHVILVNNGEEEVESKDDPLREQAGKDEAGKGEGEDEEGDKDKDKEEEEDGEKEKEGDSKKDEHPYVEVRGAGVAHVNGRYIPEGLRDGVARFIRRHNGRTYEVSRVPTRNATKNWWVSRTDVSPDIDYYTCRSTAPLPPAENWLRCSNGKDPVPSITMNEKALALKDHIPEKYLKRKDQPNRKQPGANRRQNPNRPNDGLPTVPQRVQGQRGIVELEVRVHDLRSEIEKYMDFKVSKDSKMIEPTFRCVERKLRVDIKDQLIRINGVECMGKVKEDLINIIEEDLKDAYKCTIWLLKKRLLNTEMIDDDTMKCLVSHRDLAQEVKNFLEIRNGCPTFRCNEKKLYVDKGDQLLRVEDIDVSQFENKHEVHNIVMSIGKQNVHIWIRKEEARRARERRRRQEQEKELQRFFDEKVKDAKGRRNEKMPDNKNSKLQVVNRFTAFDELMAIDRSLPENQEVPMVQQVRVYFFSKLPCIGNIELFIQFHDAPWVQQDVYYEMRASMEDNFNVYWFDLIVPKAIAVRNQPMKKNLFRMSFTVRMGAQHYRLNQAFDFPNNKTSKIIDYDFEFEEVKNILNIMQPTEILNKRMREVVRLVRDEDREQGTSWNYWSNQWNGGNNNNNNNKKSKQRPWVPIVAFHLATALRSDFPLNVVMGYARGLDLLKKKMNSDIKSHFSGICSTIQGNKGQYADLKEMLFWHLVFDECMSPRRSYEFVLNAVRLSGDDINNTLMFFAQQVKGMTGKWKARTADLFREEIRRYMDCMYCAVYANFVHACCSLAGEENWGIASTMEAELRSLRETVKISELLKTLGKDLINLDLLFCSVHEKGRILPVERIPLERYLMRIVSQSKGGNNQTTNVWSGMGWTTVSNSRDATPEQRRDAFWEVLNLLSKATGVVEDKIRERIIHDFCLHFRECIAGFLGKTFDHHLKICTWLAENGFPETMYETFTHHLPDQVLAIDDDATVKRFLKLVTTFPVLLTANTRKAILENEKIEASIVVTLCFKANLEEGRENTILYAARVFFEQMFDKIGPAKVFEIWTIPVEDPILKIQAGVEALKNKVDSISGFELITNFLNNEFVHRMEPVILNVLKERMSEVQSLELNKKDQEELSFIVATRLKDGDEVKIDLWNQILTQVLHIHEEWKLDRQIKFLCSACESVVGMCNNLVGGLPREKLPKRITQFYDYYTSLVEQVSKLAECSEITMVTLGVINDHEKVWYNIAETVKKFNGKALKSRLKEYRHCLEKRRLLRTLMSRYIPTDTERLGQDLQALAAFAKHLGNWDNHSIKAILERKHLDLMDVLKGHLEWLEKREESLVYISIWQNVFAKVLRNASGVADSFQKLSTPVGEFLMAKFHKIAQRELQLLNEGRMTKYLQKVKTFVPDRFFHGVPVVDFSMTEEEIERQNRDNERIRFEVKQMFANLPLTFGSHNDFMAYHQKLSPDDLYTVLTKGDMVIQKNDMYSKVVAVTIQSCGVQELCGQYFSQENGFTKMEDGRRYRIQLVVNGPAFLAAPTWAILRVDRNGIANDIRYFTSNDSSLNPPKSKGAWQPVNPNHGEAPTFEFQMDNHFISPPCIRSVFVDVLDETRQILKKLEQSLQNGYLRIADLRLYFGALLKEEHRMINKQLAIFDGVADTVCNDIYDSFCLSKEVSFIQDLLRLAEGLGKYCRSTPVLDDGFKEVRDYVANVNDIGDMAEDISGAASMFNQVQNLIPVKFDDIQKAWTSHLCQNLHVIEAMATEPHLKDDQEFGNLLELLDANQTNGLEAQRSVSLRKVRQSIHSTFIRGNFSNLSEVIQALANMRLTDSDVDDLVTVTESLDQIARTYNEASGDSLARDKRILYNALEYGYFDMVNPPLSSSVELAELARRCLNLKIDETQRQAAFQKLKAANYFNMDDGAVSAPKALVRSASAGDAEEDSMVLTPPPMKAVVSLPDEIDDRGKNIHDILCSEKPEGVTLARYGLQIRVQDVEDGSLGAALGFEAGDILQAINGVTCVEPIGTLNRFNESELPMSVLVKRTKKSEIENSLIPPLMEKKSSVDNEEQVDMLKNVRRNSADALLTSTVMRHSGENDLEGVLEELVNDENVAMDEKMHRIDVLSFENVESILDRLLMAILRKDVELKAKTLELESKFKIVESVCRLRCNYYLLGGRQYLSESSKVFLSIPLSHLESMEKVWKRRLDTWISKVTHIREKYTWLNYYTVNETLTIVELLNRLCIETPKKIRVRTQCLDRISGTYVQEPNLLYGRPAYRRIQKADEQNVDFILWYFGKRKMWCISSPAQIETEQAYLINRSNVLNPLKAPKKDWVMFDQDSETGMSKGQVVELSDAEQRSFAQASALFADDDEEVEEDLSRTRDDEILSHLQFAKPNCDENLVKKIIRTWDPLNNEHPDLLGQAGEFLDRVLGEVTSDTYRQLPDIANIITGIEDAKPNLYTSDAQRALSCVQAIFLQRNLVPIANQVLLCSKHTSAEDVEILLRRCFHAGRTIQLANGLSPLFVLAFPENLTTDTLKTVLDITQEFLLSDDALERFKQHTYCFAIVSCSRDNKLTQRFLQFERDDTYLNQREAMQLYSMTLCESERSFYEQRHENSIHPFVQVYSSKVVGAGKSFMIQNWGARNGAEVVRVPINSVDLQPTFVIERLLKTKKGKRVIHFDISSCAGSSVNLVLFKLVLLHHITDQGKRYQVSSKDAFLIELPTSLTISGDELEALVLESANIEQQRVDSRFWFTSVNAGLPRLNVTLDNNALIIGEDEQFVLKYLRAFRKRTTVQYGGLRGTGRDDDADFDPFLENCPDLTMDETLTLMQEYCPAGIKSRICQKNFLRFMHTQLVQIHANIYLMNWNSPQPGAIHLREMVLESMVNMSQDFSSKLYTDAAGHEDSTADAKFPLSVRWRQTEIPMVLLNQIGVKQNESGGDISLFCRNLKRMRNNPTAQLWSQIVELYQWRLVNFEAEEQQRRNQLAEDGIVIDSESAKRQKLDLLLKVVGAPDEGIRISKTEHIMQKHKNYALTFDNMLKMIAIYFRVKSGIPVLLMGETGCGKTRLMEFLSDILAIELFKCDVHGGFTADLILDFMEDPIKTALSAPHDMIWVFLDEVNTSPEIGMFKEIICDHSLNGEPLPKNLVVLGALNPVRRRKKVSSGLAAKDQAGVETYMNNLVYRVYPLPPTMKEYVWNFGHLDELDEQQYIGEMVKLAFRSEMEDGEFVLVLPRYKQLIGNELVEDVVDCVRVSFCKCLVASQKIVRKFFGGEVSVVSLRDVARCINIFSWFFKHFHEERIAHENPRDKLYRMLMESAVLALAHCYYYRLGGSRKEYAHEMNLLIEERVEIARVIENEPVQIDTEILNFIPANERQQHLNALFARQEAARQIVRRVVDHAPCNDFEAVLRSEQDRYVNLMEIPKGVATNRALKENLFMIFVCVMTKLPIVLVGKPGSSKTLSMIIIRDNLSASTKNERLSALDFQDVYLVPFQCSKLSTAQAIRDRWDFASSYQEADPNIRVLIFFDEVGLAEQSPYRPLKVFHQLLEHPEISFVGLSNWALDSAKMNRAILHNCPTHSFQDLMQTATAIVNNSTDNEALQDMLRRSLKTIATLYSSVLEKQKIADFFGARDYYACVQLITARTKVSLDGGFATEIPNDILFEAIVRSFGGMEIQEMRELLADCFTAANDRLNRDQVLAELENWTGVRALEQNLIQTRSCKDTDVLGSQARHILVLSDFETSWQILFDANILDNKDTVVIFGSQFSQDVNSTVGLYHAINRVKNCIETGQVVVLLHLEALHDALYDMLNQRYTRIGKRLYCRIAMGAESVICQVHPHFKCIVVGAKIDAYTGRIPVAFLNRFEKQVIDRRQMMDTKSRQAEKMMMLKFNVLKNWDAGLLTVDRFFPGFMDETLPSLFACLLTDNPDLPVLKLVEAGLQEMLKNAYAECFVTENARHLFQPFTDIVQCVEEAAMEAMENSAGITQVIRTHDRIYASDTIEQCFDESKLSVRVVQLDEFLTEVEFSQFLTQFANGFDYDTLIVQCNHKGDNLPHILHAKHMVERVQSQLEKAKNLVMLIHTPRIRKQKSSSAVRLQARDSTFPLVFDRTWNSVYVDALLPGDILGVPSISEIGHSIISDILANDPSNVLLRIFRKSLSQLRFAQPVKMLEEIKAIQLLLSGSSWDNGTLLNLLINKLLSMLDTEEFKRPVSSVVLERIKGEGIQQWSRGAFRDRLVNWTDKIIQNCFAHQLKLLYEHGNFNLYNQYYFAKVADEHGEVIEKELHDLWIRTVSDDRLVRPVRIAISDRPDSIHVPHAFKARFPFSATLDSWACSKRSEIEALIQSEDKQSAVAEILSKLIAAQNWRVSYKILSQYAMGNLVRDILDAHIAEIYTERSEDSGDMGEGVRQIASSFIFQSAFSNVVILDEEEEEEVEARNTDSESGEEEANDFKDTELNAHDKQAEQNRIEELRKVKSDVALHDIFPALWYNSSTISHVIRLFCISQDEVRETIQSIWRPSASDMKDAQVHIRVGKTLRMAVDAMSQLLTRANVETLGRTTEMIVSATNSVDELLVWLEGKLGAEGVEDITRNWRMLQLKLMLARNIQLEAAERMAAYSRVESDFVESRMFNTADGFKALIMIVESMVDPTHSETLSRVILQYLTRFAFAEETVDIQLVECLLSLINPYAISLISEGYTLSDVAKVQIAWHLVHLMQDISVGEAVHKMIDNDLANCEVLDDELPCLFLVVIEENLSKQGQRALARKYKFEAQDFISYEYLTQIARGKLIITTYCNSLCNTIVKPEEATLEMLGGPVLLERMFSIMYPNDSAFLPFHYFFLKQLFRFGGVTWVHAFCENPEIVEHLVSKLPIMERVQICSEVDPFVVWGEAYRSIREELIAICTSPERDFGLQITPRDLTPLIAALYSSVYRPASLHGTFPALIRFLKSPNAATLLRECKEAPLVLQLAMNKFPEQSALRYTREFDQWHRYVSQIAMHMVAVLPNLSSSHFSNLIHKPDKYLEGFIPSMPKDTSEALGNLVGAAAWVCPNGHVYYIGDCTRPWIEAKCHCGAQIGGVNHNPVAGNDRLQSKQQDRASEFGYLLMGTDGEVRDMNQVRDMDVQTTKTMRLLIHACLLLGHSQTGLGPPQTLERLLQSMNAPQIQVQPNQPAGLQPGVLPDFVLGANNPVPAPAPDNNDDLVPPPPPPGVQGFARDAHALAQRLLGKVRKNPEPAPAMDDPNEPVDYANKSPVAKLCQGQGYGPVLTKFLFEQIKGYLQQLATILELQVEEAVLFLHLVIRQFAETYNDAFPEGVFKLDEEERMNFEQYFSKVVVKPLLPASRSIEKLRNEHLQLNELLAEMWEKVDLSTAHGQQFQKNYLPNLMLSPQSMDLEGFTITLLKDQANKERFPCLWALATARPSIWVIQHLPAIQRWCKMMLDRYNRKITREQAKKLMIGKILDDIRDNFWGDRQAWAETWKEFLACWNEIYRLINIDDHTRLDELRHDCVHIYQYIMEFDDDPNSVSSVWACPDEQDEGLCINTIVDHLVQIHNRFMTESGNSDATAPIMNSDVCSKANLTDVDKETVEALVRSHCVRPLRYGASNKLEFDLEALEKEMKDRYVLGKGEVRAMLPFFEFSGAVKIESLFDSAGLPKEKLDRQMLQTICSFQSGLERQHALEIVEETILLLARLGVDNSGEQPIFEFMKSVLKMQRRDWQLFYHKDLRSEIRLKHLFSIWQFLQKQIAYDDPKRLAAPEGTDPCYLEPITADLENQLLMYLKAVSLGEIEDLIFAWYDVLKSACTDERKDTSGLWAVWLQASNLKSKKMLESMPEVTLANAGSAYAFLAKKFFSMRGHMSGES